MDRVPQTYSVFASSNLPIEERFTTSPTIESGIDVLPIPIVGSVFLLVCIAVLFVSFWQHFHTSDRKEIAWLRTKPKSTANTTFSPGPGRLIIRGENYEYSVSQVSHFTESERFRTEKTGNLQPIKYVPSRKRRPGKGGWAPRTEEEDTLKELPSAGQLRPKLSAVNIEDVDPSYWSYDAPPSPDSPWQRGFSETKIKWTDKGGSPALRSAESLVANRNSSFGSLESKTSGDGSPMLPRGRQVVHRPATLHNIPDEESDATETLMNKTYTGILSVTRLHKMIEERREQARRRDAGGRRKPPSSPASHMSQH